MRMAVVLTVGWPFLSCQADSQKLASPTQNVVAGEPSCDSLTKVF